MTDFRALCAELLDELVFRPVLLDRDLIDRARAAQAEPADALAAVAEQPRPDPPAEGEVAELVAKLRRLAPQNPLGSADPTITRAAALLEQLAAASPAVVPVAVTERLPGPEDCVPHPRTKLGSWCWGFERYKVSLARPARWRLMHMETVEMEASHWLPAHALPLPAPQGGEVEP